MEFGRVSPAQLQAIDFTLPAEPAHNLLVLKGKATTSPTIYLGCPSWARPEWAGKIFPLKTSPNNYLQHYTRQFNCIELNATHYKVYDQQTIRGWKAKTIREDFKFCPKFFQGITHDGILTNKQELTSEFLNGLAAFDNHLGPTLIQLSDSFSPERQTELFQFLGSLSSEFSYFLEVRHTDWYTRPEHRKALFSQLQQLQMGAVITDTASRRDCAHMQLTIPCAFVRFVGNSLHPSDYTRVDEWVQRIKQWINSGLEQLYFFVHMREEITSPDLIVYLAEQLNKHTGLAVPAPVYVPQQKGLFD